MNYRKNNLITELVAEVKSRTGKFDSAKMKEVFTLIQAAKKQGYLGANRPKSICLNEWVNAANELLRSQNSALIDSLAGSDAVYAYIALISLGCLKDSHRIAA